MWVGTTRGRTDHFERWKGDRSAWCTTHSKMFQGGQEECNNCWAGDWAGRRWKKKELGNILGALQPGQGLTPRIHGNPKRLFTVSSFMYLRPGPIHHQHLNTPLLITLPMLSNELEANEGKQQLVHWSGCQVLQCLKKIHEKGHVGHKFSVFSQWDTR